MRPVTADPEHDEALAAIDRLMDRNAAAGTAAADRLATRPTREAINFAMEYCGYSCKDLELALG